MQVRIYETGHHGRATHVYLSRPVWNRDLPGRANLGDSTRLGDERSPRDRNRTGSVEQSAVLER